MENKIDDEMLMKLLEIENEKPGCCFSLGGDLSGLNAVQMQELVQQLNMKATEVRSAMRRLVKRGYLSYMDIKDAPNLYVFLTDEAKVYVVQREHDKAIEDQKERAASGLQTLSISVKEQFELAKKEAENAERSAKRAQWLTIIEIIVASLYCCKYFNCNLFKMNIQLQCWWRCVCEWCQEMIATGLVLSELSMGEKTSFNIAAGSIYPINL